MATKKYIKILYLSMLDEWEHDDKENAFTSYMSILGLIFMF